MRRTRSRSIWRRKASCSVWLETHKKIKLELALLHRLLESQRSLLQRVRDTEPDGTELLATSALLHSFYTGVENIFKRIALEIDESLPAGQKSHSDLLLQMDTRTGKRPAVIPAALRMRLGEYMDFRHVFRHAYSFDLSWSKMRGLVVNCDDTLGQLESALDEFFDTDN
jgi:hypothetical protein